MVGTIKSPWRALTPARSAEDIHAGRKPRRAEGREVDDGRLAIDVAVPECKERMQAALFLLGRFDVDEGMLLHRSATAAVAAHRLERHALLCWRRVGLDPQYVVAVTAVFADGAAVKDGDAAWQELKNRDEVTTSSGLRAPQCP